MRLGQIWAELRDWGRTCSSNWNWDLSKSEQHQTILERPGIGNRVWELGNSVNLGGRSSFWGCGPWDLTGDSGKLGWH